MARKGSIKCEYLSDEKYCKAVRENDEGKAAREESCTNESNEACCYACKEQSTCEISCNYLLKKPAFGAKLEEFRGEYFGGHPAYPKKQDVHIVLEEESLIIPELNLSLPYRSLKKIENITGEKISAARVALFGAVGLGTVGALWKKEQTYMVLTYHDKEASSNLGLVFKVPHIEKVQPLIYKKMIEAKK